MSSIIRSKFLPSVFLLGLVCLSGCYSKQFIAPYLGVSDTQNERFRAKETVSGGSQTRTSVREDFDRSIVGGIRSGGWFKDNLNWLGFAMEASQFNVQGDFFERSTVVTFGPLLMIRYPLMVTADYPEGTIRPYVAAGPALFVSDMTVRNIPGISEGVSETPVDVALGLDAKGGVAFQLGEGVSIFGEFRYTQFEVGLDEDDRDDFFDFSPNATRSVRQLFNTRHYILGLEFTF